MEGKKSVLVRQTVYVVEKFAPTHCPKCSNSFAKNSQDGYLLFTFWQHDTIEHIRAIAKSIQCPAIATDLIACGKCQNVTLRVLIERRTCVKKSSAQRALQEGFVNLTTTTYTGKKRLRGNQVVRFLPADARPGTEFTVIPVKDTKSR